MIDMLFLVWLYPRKTLTFTLTKQLRLEWDKEKHIDSLRNEKLHLERIKHILVQLDTLRDYAATACSLTATMSCDALASAMLAKSILTAACWHACDCHDTMI